MNMEECWWSSPRRVSVVVDNDSWILPFADQLVKTINANGDTAAVVRNHDEIANGDVAFYFGCVKITPPEVLARNKRNLVIHASDLPQGRGFSPLTWQIIEGAEAIPVCLIHAAEQVDAGPIIFKEYIQLNGSEILNELRDALGAAHIALAMRYLSAPQEPPSHEQSGEATYLKRRHPEDSCLDPHKTLAEQFNLLRTVDNERYPAFFNYAGYRYFLRIDKCDPERPS